MVGVGEAADLIHHAQLAWMPAAERRRYALTGPPPPQWFADMQPAPWIDGHVISEGQKLAGVSLVRVPRVGVPPGQDIHVPAQTRRHVPPPDTGTGPQPDLATARRPGKHRAAGPDDEPARSTGTVARHRAALPGDEAQDIIVGIAAAARYLGYDKPDSFRRARTRHPIPGEGKTDDGRPCWTARTLRSWQSKRKIAGNRTHDGDLDLAAQSVDLNLQLRT